MTDQKPPEQVLADWRSDAQVLRARGYAHDAELIEQFAADVARAFEPYLSWLNESDARLYSGLSLATLRRRRAELVDAGNARSDGRGGWQYKQSSLPHRPDVAAAREAGRTGRRVA